MRKIISVFMVIMMAATMLPYTAFAASDDVIEGETGVEDSIFGDDSPEPETHKHNWETKYTVDIYATTAVSGSKSYHCTGCEETKGAVTIPRIKKVSLGYTSTTYNGKVRMPAVGVYDYSGNKLVNNEDYTVKYASGRKYVGTYNITVTFKGEYKGTVEKSFKINPPTTYITSLKSSKKRHFTVKWKKRTTQVTGYQIRYSTSSTFKSNVAKKTVTNNKTTSKLIKTSKSKKYYYVQVRTYKKVNGTIYYSAWSKTKKIKVK